MSSHNLAVRFLIRLVRGYQNYVSPLKMGSTCRFEPTCSAYALQALKLHGALKGTLLFLVRFSKCGPWHPGGYDPVPDRGVETQNKAQEDQM
ncbi:membrane protein insertion efficiency factor YidD [Corynebacterium freiburgense]|uniref:membrane protein insertion efficiency factor YidD n=1 Tax=Corynebacterium freiburgense TaxID=556548 RepID=UPI0004016DA2|nr:membrane protein insertion efficiency factor YidD [Corynebacterium freiburgense]